MILILSDYNLHSMCSCHLSRQPISALPPPYPHTYPHHVCCVVGAIESLDGSLAVHWSLCTRKLHSCDQMGQRQTTIARVRYTYFALMMLWWWWWWWWWWWRDNVFKSFSSLYSIGLICIAWYVIWQNTLSIYPFTYPYFYYTNTLINLRASSVSCRSSSLKRVHAVATAVVPIPSTSTPLLSYWPLW